MPEVDLETFKKVSEIMHKGQAALTSPVVLLLYVDGSWKLFENSVANRVLQWFPKNALSITESHRPWFNVLHECNTRVFCGELGSLLVSLNREDPRGLRQKGLLTQLSGEEATPHASLRDEIERNFIRLTGGSNAIAVALRYAKEELNELCRVIWSGDDNPKRILAPVFANSHQIVFGTKDKYATGAKDQEDMIRHARIVDSQRVPMPDVSKTAGGLIEDAIESMCKVPPSH